MALNPHTGQVLALVGGRNYGASQLNHAVAKRPTGSIFKPFVYAAAFQTAAEGTMLPGQTKLFSPVTMLSDQQTTYDVGGQEYTPRNYQGEYYGEVTARFALMRSDNNATISLAAMVGFDRVAALARDAGIKSARGTPSVAIGSYDASPLEMAGAYTVFANNGLHLDPMDAGQRAHAHGRHHLGLHAHIETGAGSARGLSDDEHDGGCAARRVGTGAGVRNMGFVSPAAGKTGTEPRCMVCRLYHQPAVHRLGGQRRLLRSSRSRARAPPLPSGRRS